MEIKTKSNRMYAFLILFDMHTKFFQSALGGISDEDAKRRMETKANHIAWLAGSLVQQRFDLANLFGADQKSKADELFKNNKGLQDDAVYPSLDIYKQDWKKISPLLRNLLMDSSDEQLDKILDFPGMSFSIFEMISFNTYREANMIGQIALWRRLLNYEGIKYM